MVVICSYYEINNGFGERQLFAFTFDTEINHTLLAFIVLATGSAIFYVYHYLYHFAKIFYSNAKKFEFWVSGFLAVGGMSLIVMSVIFFEVSVVFVGFGWLIVTLLHGVLSVKKFPNKIAKTRLQREWTLYLGIAVTLMVLNIFALRFFGGVTELHYAIFTLLVCFIIRQQVHKDFMIAKLIEIVTVDVAAEGQKKQ
jgi:hypothetical protein